MMVTMMVAWALQPVVLLTSITKQGKGLVVYDAWPVEFGMDNEFDTFNMKTKAFERYSFGWDDWRGIRGNAGA